MPYRSPRGGHAWTLLDWTPPEDLTAAPPRLRQRGRGPAGRPRTRRTATRASADGSEGEPEPHLDRRRP
jgi:hypothetical protein